MKYSILGHPPDGPTLTLDYREFSYAGKFVMSKTGKSVAVENDEIVGAIAFNADHDDPAVGHLRYVTVREDRQGEGIGAKLLRFTAESLQPETYEVVAIAVNNPIAYRACYRAGFTYTGQETGIAEVVLHYAPDEQSKTAEYRDGLRVFRGRDLPPDQRAVLDRTTVPDVVDIPSTAVDSEE